VYENNADGSFSRSTPQDFLGDRASDGSWTRYFDFDPEEQFNREFWGSPGVLYHGTRNLGDVLREGLEPRSETRGLGNRAVGAAVFTTVEEDTAAEHAHGHDGGVVEIDCKRMKRDKLTPFVAQEPEIIEDEMVGALAHRLGIEYEHECSDAGIDPDTVIVYGPIPPRYLRRVKV